MIIAVDIFPSLENNYHSCPPTLMWTTNAKDDHYLMRVIDLCGCRMLQSAYVMLSRVSCLNNLGVLRWFSPNKIESTLKPQFRQEFERLDILADKTRRRMSDLLEFEDM